MPNPQGMDYKYSLQMVPHKYLPARRYNNYLPEGTVL